ncbi:MAG: hypothetical protein WBG62_20990, partial [Cyclobacteriaceae bacterium]
FLAVSYHTFRCSSESACLFQNSLSVLLAKILIKLIVLNLRTNIFSFFPNLINYLYTLEDHNSKVKPVIYALIIKAKSHHAEA